MIEGYEVKEILWQGQGRMVLKASGPQNLPVVIWRLTRDPAERNEEADALILEGLEQLKNVAAKGLRGFIDAGIDSMDGAIWAVAWYWQGEVLANRVEQGTLTAEQVAQVRSDGQRLIAGLGMAAGALSFRERDVIRAVDENGQTFETFVIDLERWVKDLLADRAPGASISAEDKLDALCERLRLAIRSGSSLPSTAWRDADSRSPSNSATERLQPDAEKKTKTPKLVLGGDGTTLKTKSSGNSQVREPKRMPGTTTTASAARTTKAGQQATAKPVSSTAPQLKSAKVKHGVGWGVWAVVILGFIGVGVFAYFVLQPEENQSHSEARVVLRDEKPTKQATFSQEPETDSKILTSGEPAKLGANNGELPDKQAQREEKVRLAVFADEDTVPERIPDIQLTPAEANKLPDLEGQWVRLRGNVLKIERGRDEFRIVFSHERFLPESVRVIGPSDIKARVNRFNRESIQLTGKVVRADQQFAVALLDWEDVEIIEGEADSIDPSEYVHQTVVTDADQAREHIGLMLFAEGTVETVRESSSGKTAYLIFSERGEWAFGCSVLKRRAEEGLDRKFLEELIGKKVRVKGQVSEEKFSKRVVIQFTDKSDIEVLE